MPALPAFARSLLGAAALATALAGGALAWTPTWTASSMNTQPGDTVLAGFYDQTLREVVRVSVGGEKVRLRLSNEFGSDPVTIDKLHVAIAGDTLGTIVEGTDRAVTFGGRESVTLLPGAPALSDPVELEVPPLARLAISSYFKDRAPIQTYHYEATQTALVSPVGDFTDAVTMPEEQRTTSHYFVNAVLVESTPDQRAVVAFGDSITDGYLSTLDADRRYPDRLAERVLATAGLENVAVVNQGIGGNRLLSGGRGAPALARLDRDVIALPNVSHVILLMGINDIGWASSMLAPSSSAPTAEDVIAAYGQIIERARAEGIKVIGATMTPFEGAFENFPPLRAFYSPEKEEVRVAVNEWIRTGGAFDGVVDFDAAVRDPDHPSRIRAEFDGGDHLHPGDAGYQAMADAVDLKLLGLE